jgi:hypothetical protein
VTGALGAMRVLLLVGPIPADVIVATRFVAPELRRRIVAALLAMRQSDPGIAALFDATLLEPVPAGHLALLRPLARGATRPASARPPSWVSGPVALDRLRAGTYAAGRIRERPRTALSDRWHSRANVTGHREDRVGGMAEVFRAESAGLEGFKKTVAISASCPTSPRRCSSSGCSSTRRA